MPFSENNEYGEGSERRIQRKTLFRLSGVQNYFMSETEIQNEPKQTSSKDGYADALTRAKEYDYLDTMRANQGKGTQLEEN